MFFVYHLLRQAPMDCIHKSDGVIVPLHFSLNMLKIIVESIAIFIVVDIISGGLIDDEQLQESLVEYFKICLKFIVPLIVSVLSCMIFSGVLIPNDYTEDDRILL
eukprot:scaffold20186_cov71-Cyclotella_meneghiniana.AAC.8